MSHRIDVEKTLLQELMENSPDYIFIKDRQSRFVITNKSQAQLLLGLENHQDAVGKTDFDLFPHKREDAQRFYDEEQAIMSTGEPVIRREWMVPSSTTGAIVWLSESKLPIRDETGEIVGLIGLGRDITARKQEQLLRERLAHQLETAIQVARIASGILEPYELTQQIVNLVRERFNFYYVGLFLVDQVQRIGSGAGEVAILRAATGEVGEKLLHQGYRIKAGSDSMVGQCLVTEQPSFAQRGIEKKSESPMDTLLPAARTEIVIPLINRQKLIGVLDIQSTIESAFFVQDLAIFEILAAQLVISIQNALLFQELDQELKKTKRDLDTYVRAGWNKFSKDQ